MLQRIASLPSHLKSRRRTKEYMDNRRILDYAPYHLNIYRDLIHLVFETGAVDLLPFLAISSRNSTRSNLYVRHDIDTIGCIENLPKLLKIDRQFGIQSGVYFQVMGDAYDLADYKDDVRQYRADGFEIGLHTVCYTEDDYIAAFEQETNQFVDIMGFQPASFTVHGLGQYRLQVRQQFREEIAARLDEFGYKFTDCHRQFRKYAYVIQDCHWDQTKQARFVYDDFTEFPPVFQKNANFLLLTHPTYWVV